MAIRRMSMLLLLLVIMIDSYSQQNKVAAPWRFRSINQVGLLQGEDAPAFLLQTVNGFERNNFFGGIGAGLDYYRFKSIPLFGEVRKYFGHQRQQFFIYAGPGINFVWEKSNKSDHYTSQWKTGFYGDGGVGYRWNFAGGTGLLVSTGYTYKRVTEKQSAFICPFIGPCYMNVDTYNYNLNRLVIKMGLLF